MFGDFRDQVAVITGGAGGIGLATAKLLAPLGARIVLWDRDRAALARAQEHLGHRPDGLVREVDVTDATDVEQAATEAQARFGRIDILITSAGITGPNETTWDYPLADWNHVLAVNLGGVYHACRAVAPHMLRRRYGRIVNVASIGGKEGNARAPAYAASKGAVIALTKSLGKELIGSDVVANAICPAAVETELLQQMQPGFVQGLIAKIPMGRLGRPEEVGGLILYLSSPSCSFSTGAVFDCSGGRATY